MKILLCFCCLLMMLFCLPPVDVNAQELKISGTLTSERTGEVLPGANIAVLGTSLGTTSDFQGKFSLQLTGMTQATLVVSFVGYKTIEVPVTSSTDDLSVSLEEDILKLSEVVTTGFASSVKRANLANTVATISADELVRAPAQTLGQALAGKFAGINVSQNTGAPGGGISITLRGLSTIEGATQPLYVVDGVIVNNAATQSGIDLITKAATAGSATPQGQPVNRIADINPNEIQNIEVLKGASAAALYGSKATNGVILITTKQGVPGITRINVNHQIGFSSLLRDVGFRTFDSYLKAVNQYGADGAAEGLNSTGLAAYNALKAQIGSDSINNKSSPDLNALFGGNWAGRNIDYEDVIYGENGLINESNVRKPQTV